jgi:hypothetical protein
MMYVLDMLHLDKHHDMACYKDMMTGVCALFTALVKS